ncbi:MAG: IclR family transcriptional regulator [Burkholderiaceae bacterium]|nr:IclR family transcriptional regulator [Burkholderiaceae bacterium]
MSTNPRIVKSAARVLQVLEFFDGAKRSAPVAEVADHYGWPHSSTSMLMRSLVALGYLHYDAGGRRYLPTVRVRLLGDWMQQGLFDDGQLAALMESLAAQTRETIVLASRNGLHAQYLRVVQGGSTLRMHLRIGTLRPLLSSGSGHMLLAGLPNATIRRLVRRHNAEYAADQRIDPAELLATIEACRERGYAVSHNLVTPLAGMIAFSLPTREDEEPLVIAIGGPTDRLIANEADYVRVVRETLESFVTGRGTASGNQAS